MRAASPLTVLFALGPALAAQAAEPYCRIEESCRVTRDNCAPLEGRIDLVMTGGGKAKIVLDGREMGEGSVLGLNGITALIFTDAAGVQNQLRIQDDGRFNYLVSRPDADAPKGKDQILYRGQCVEGS